MLCLSGFELYSRCVPLIKLREFGIPQTIGIPNPSSTKKESGIQYLKSGIHSVESRIQHCLGLQSNL